MLTRSKQVDRLERMNDRIRAASAVTADLMSDFASTACDRLPMLDRAGNAERIQGLIESGAWTDTALALVEIELPRWKLRRLVLDEGKWLCSLSRQVNLPVWLDDMAEVSHEDLPLAIIGALLEAKRCVLSMPEKLRTVPRVPTANYGVSCDNFS